MPQTRSLKMPLGRTPARRARPAGPHCRGGASSVLRLAQPVAPRLPNALDLSGWMSRAGDVLLHVTGPLAAWSEPHGAR